MKKELEAKRQKGWKRLDVLLAMMCIIMTLWKGIEVSIIWVRFAFDCLREWTALSDRMIDAISAVVVCIPSVLIATFIVCALCWVVKYTKAE